MPTLTSNGLALGSAGVLLVLLLTLWVQERLRWIRERDTIERRHQRDLDAIMEGHENEVRVWKRRLLDCEERLGHHPHERRWYDKEPGLYDQGPEAPEPEAAP